MRGRLQQHEIDRFRHMFGIEGVDYIYLRSSYSHWRAINGLQQNSVFDVLHFSGRGWSFFIELWQGENPEYYAVICWGDDPCQSQNRQVGYQSTMILRARRYIMEQIEKQRAEEQRVTAAVEAFASYMDAPIEPT